MNSDAAWTMYVALGVFGFLWCGSGPYTTDLIISVDETRASAPLVLPLIFIGLSIGALAASFFVGASVIGAFHLSIAFFVLATACFALIFWLKRRTTPAGQAQLSPAIETVGR
jgi:hypothetical protein